MVYYKSICGFMSHHRHHLPMPRGTPRNIQALGEIHHLVAGFRFGPQGFRLQDLVDGHLMAIFRWKMMINI
jgi:hypothetical protein